MEADRRRWNQRYAERDGRSTTAELVRAWCPAGPGTALDVAGGDGGNCELLAARGFEVDVVDISEVALARLRGRPCLHPIVADLDTWRPPPAAYDVVLMIMFFDHRLLPSLRAALRPGGRAIMQCFAHPPPGHDGWLPGNPDYAATLEQLTTAFADCELRAHALVQRARHDGPPAWLAQLVADAPA